MAANPIAAESPGVGPPRQSDVPRKLARAQRRLNMLGCSEGRGTRFHVDVGGETSIDHWCTRMGQLRQGDAGERLSVLERESAGNSEGRHGAGQAERRDDGNLAPSGEVDDALGHGNIELAWRVRVDDGVAMGTGPELSLG